jgi:hypothetical protein
MPSIETAYDLIDKILNSYEDVSDYHLDDCDISVLKEAKEVLIKLLIGTTECSSISIKDNYILCNYNGCVKEKTYPGFKFQISHYNRKHI